MRGRCSKALLGGLCLVAIVFLFSWDDSEAAACRGQGQSVSALQSCCDWLEKSGRVGKKTCQPCGGNGKSPCGLRCKSGLEMRGLPSKCRPCGADGQIPCKLGGCNSGFMMNLSTGKCAGCGGGNQVPCLKGACSGDLILGSNGRCMSEESCGGLNQALCAPPRGCDKGLIPGTDGKCYDAPSAGEILDAGKKVLGTVQDAVACPARPDPGGCPLKGPMGKVVLFDRCQGSVNPLNPQPTAAGNALCGALVEAPKLARSLGQNATAFHDRVEAKVHGATAELVEEVMPPALLETLGEVQEAGQEVWAPIEAYARDEECGVPGALDEAKEWFQTKVNNADTFAKLTIKRVEASKELALAVAKAAKAKQASRDLAKKYPDKEDVTKEISSTVVEFQKSLVGLSFADGGNSGQSGQSTRAQDSAMDKGGNPGPPPHAGGPGDDDEEVEAKPIYPLVLEGVGCGASLVACGIAIKDAVVAAGGGVACPETVGVGCVVTFIFGTKAGITAVLGVVGSALVCTTMVADGVTNWDAYKARWQELFGSDDSASSADSQRYASSSGLSAQVNSSGQDLGSQARQDLATVTDAMDSSVAHLKSWNDIRNNEIKPLKAQLGDGRVDQFEKNFFQFVHCWEKVQGVAKEVGGEVGEGINDVAAVLEELKPAETAANRIKEAGLEASQAARKAVQARWDVFNQNYKALHQELLGIPPGNPQQRVEVVAKHMGSLVTNPGRVQDLKNQLVQLKKGVASLVDDTVKDAEAKLQDGAGANPGDLAKKVKDGHKRLKTALSKVKNAHSTQRATK